MTDPSALVREVLQEIEGCLATRWPPVLEESEVRAKLGPVRDLSEALLRARVQKAGLTALSDKLAAAPELGQRFADKPSVKWIAALVTRARLTELSRVHIVRRASRASKGYDITELVRSYYGRQVLARLDFDVSRRRVVDADEMATIRNAFSAIKLALPEVVERTTTEKFFDPED